MNKKEIFLLAARELKLNIQEEKTIEINDDMYLTKIKIGKVLCRDPCNNETEEFSGKPALTKNMSIQNAYSAALAHLETKRMVTVYDYNADNVSRLKKELFSSESWSMLFQYKANKLAHALHTRDEKLRAFLCSFDSFCQRVSASYPPPAAGVNDAPSNKRPRRRFAAGDAATSATKKPRRGHISDGADEDAALPAPGLSRWLAGLRTDLLCLLGDPDETGPRSCKETATHQEE